ncbi:hypothetical protein IE53DRAFT_363084 [Violaceomyces palustris]|uniref:Uncharacterized protein n=1 Tax=Violaceomyces palustris TaxID=1673888 RepID=A0ACD0NUK1_9BASI|nr:hypothetical protein IE53DRAFT_363084 [Violaceomyces palustris]
MNLSCLVILVYSSSVLMALCLTIPEQRHPLLKRSGGLQGQYEGQNNARAPFPGSPPSVTLASSSSCFSIPLGGHEDEAQVGPSSSPVLEDMPSDRPRLSSPSFAPWSRSPDHALMPSLGAYRGEIAKFEDYVRSLREELRSANLERASVYNPFESPASSPLMLSTNSNESDDRFSLIKETNGSIPKSPGNGWFRKGFSTATDGNPPIGGERAQDKFWRFGQLTRPKNRGWTQLRKLVPNERMKEEDSVARWATYKKDSLAAKMLEDDFAERLLEKARKSSNGPKAKVDALVKVSGNLQRGNDAIQAFGGRGAEDVRMTSDLRSFSKTEEREPVKFLKDGGSGNKAVSRLLDIGLGDVRKVALELPH